ncbi:MAG: hypothetical protein ABI210_09635 [Abditibacteriaceae bacterium]
MTTKIKHRITSLERIFMRCHADFQAESVAVVRDAGFTGVLVNGGSGIGPDMMTPESLVPSPIIPDLMPLTVKAHQREMKRRCGLLKEVGLAPWLCVFGVPGPDQSESSTFAISTHHMDRRSKLEMTAKMDRSPEIFGYRDPQAGNWRGSRPLCISHPTVREFYRDLFPRILAEYSDMEGIFFFPGDIEAEACDDHCPRCRESGLDSWGRMLRYVNEVYSAIAQEKPGVKFYFTIWNQIPPYGSVENMERFLAELDPGIDICMSLSDNVVQQRKSGEVKFFQPWVNIVTPGKEFLDVAARSANQGRNMMVMAEISQSEVWDPVCHNVPNPHKVVELLKNAEKVPAADALFDFWGHRGPFLPHANHAAMRAYFDHPQKSSEDLLQEAVINHYGLEKADESLRATALQCWEAFDRAVDQWALKTWPQRFSYAIGRESARGPYYKAFIPAILRDFKHSWHVMLLSEGNSNLREFADFQLEDCRIFCEAAEQFDRLADEFESADLQSAKLLARREARKIELAGDLLANQGRLIFAALAVDDGDDVQLRQIVEDEIDARERQLEISGRIGWGGGVHPLLVSEDIQNMRLFLSHDAFPNVPDDCFQFTPSPYST